MQQGMSNFLDGMIVVWLPSIFILVWILYRVPI